MHSRTHWSRWPAVMGFCLICRRWTYHEYNPKTRRVYCTAH